MNISDSHATADQIRDALKAVLAAFEMTENKATLAAIQEKAGFDLVKLMEDTLPVVVQIQQESIKEYGFTDNVSGVLKFTKIVQSYEKKDKEIAALSNNLKRNLILIIPRLPVYVPQDIT